MTDSYGQNESTIELSIVIPAYRSAHSVGELCDRLVSMLNRLGRSYEIIFIEDASPDNTWAELCRVREKHGERIVLVRLATNSGQHNALMCGFRLARGRIIATTDDDLQCEPEVLADLLDKLEREDLDLVYGNYPINGQRLMRTIASVPIRIFTLIAFRLSIPPTSMRVMRRQLLESILYYRGPFTVVDGLLCWNTRRIGGMQIKRRDRPHGSSTYTTLKLVGLAFNVFTCFSIVPLRLISLAGVLMYFIAGIIGFASVVGLRIGDNPAWFLPLVAIILLLSGTQLLSLGLMCEYLGRIFISLNGKPQYLIREFRGIGETTEDRQDDVRKLIAMHVQQATTS